MQQPEISLKMVTLKEPCTACHIIAGLMKETIAKIQQNYSNVQVEFIELNDLKRVHEIQGLEVEKFPAIIINDQQVTAGSLLPPSHFKAMIDQLSNGGNPDGEY
jgi:hypothetical protein